MAMVVILHCYLVQATIINAICKDLSLFFTKSNGAPVGDFECWMKFLARFLQCSLSMLRDHSAIDYRLDQMLVELHLEPAL